MASFISNKQSSMAYLYDMLTNTTTKYGKITKTISVESEEELERVIEKIVESMGNRFRHMIVNKRQLKEYIKNSQVKITQRILDEYLEVEFYLNNLQSNEVMESYLTNRQVVSNDKFYNELQDELIRVFEEVGGFVQNQLVDPEKPIRLIPTSKLFEVYPRIKFVHDKIFISAIVNLIE